MDWQWMVIYWLEELSKFLILEGDTDGVFRVKLAYNTVRPQDSKECRNMPGFYQQILSVIC